MINLLAILISTGMVMYVVIRAAKLDRIRPWFETRSLYEQEQKRERAAREVPKNKIHLGRRSDFFGRPPNATSAREAWRR
jgi:hypothetical protein